MMEELKQIPVSLIEPDPNQPRQHFDDAGLQELADSIVKNGLIQPVAVTELDNGRYRLIYGERRWRAHKLAGLETIRAIVSDSADPAAILTRQVIENEYQTPLNPIEQAMVYRRLNTAGLDGQPWPLMEIAHRFNKAENTIAKYLRLLELDAPIQALVADGKWPVDRRATVALLSIPDAEARIALAERLTENGKVVNIPSLVRSCEVLKMKLVQAQNGRAPKPAQPAQPTDAEARRVAKVNLPDNGRLKVGQLRATAALTCAKCEWRTTAGMTEPAWFVFNSAVNNTCDECRYKMGGDDLSVCRDCPLPVMLIKLAEVAHV
jgi:ParB family transcriptional regulator, chromosome partitioning protein